MNLSKAIILFMCLINQTNNTINSQNQILILIKEDFLKNDLPFSISKYFKEKIFQSYYNNTSESLLNSYYNYNGMQVYGKILKDDLNPMQTTNLIEFINQFKSLKFVFVLFDSCFASWLKLINEPVFLMESKNIFQFKNKVIIN
jgi:UDP-glucose 4-epimerase